MTRHLRGWACGLFGLVLCLCIGQSEGQVQPAKSVAPEKLLPAGAFLYFTSDGLDAHDVAWKKTAAYESLYSSGVMALLEKLVTWGLEQGQPESAAFARSAFDTITKKGYSVAVSFPAGSEGPALPQAVIVLHQGANLKAPAGQMVKEMFQGQLDFSEKTVSGRTVTSAVIPEGAGAELGWWAEGQHLVIVAGADSIGATIAAASGKSPDITTSPLWKKVRTVKNRELSSVAWLDVNSLASRFGAFPLPLPTDGEPPTVKGLVEALGLEGLKSVVMQSGYEGRATWSETTIETKGARTGLLAIFDQKTLSLADLPPLPVDVTTFSMQSLDIGKTYDDLLAVGRKVSKMGPPGAAEEFERNLDDLPKQMGFDLKKDFFDALGSTACVYDDPMHGTLWFGIAAAVKVKDAAKLRKSLDTLLARMEEMAGEQGPSFKPLRIKKHGREIVSLSIMERGQVMPFGVSYAIDRDWMVIGMMTQTVEAFLLRLDGKLPSAQKQASFAEITKAVPAKFSGLTVSDPRKTYGFVLSWAPWLMSMAQLGMQQAQQFGGGAPTPQMPFNASDLPPAEVFVRPLFPNVSYTTVDEQGIHMISHTSLPSMPLMGFGGDGAATTGIAIALLLPAVQQAREAARRSQSKNNMKQLGLAMHNYHDTNNGFPMGAHPSEDVKVEKRLSFLFDLLPYLDQAPLYNQMKPDEAWDSDANKKAAMNAIPMLLNPGVAEKPGEFGHTHYVGLAGVGKETLTAKEHDQKTGVFGYERKVRLQDIADGTSNTIMISEASKDFPNWAEAKGSIRALTKKPYINGPDGIGGPFRGGCHVLMGDGSVRFVSESIDAATFEALVTVQGGEVVGDF